MEVIPATAWILFVLLFLIFYAIALCVGALCKVIKLLERECRLLEEQIKEPRH